MDWAYYIITFVFVEAQIVIWKYTTESIIIIGFLYVLAFTFEYYYTTRKRLGRPNQFEIPTMKKV